VAKQLEYYAVYVIRWCANGRERWHATQQGGSSCFCHLCAVVGSEVCFMILHLSYK